MIIPISAFANSSMEELQLLFKTEFGRMYISTFHQRPAQLFDGVLQSLSVFITTKHNSEHTIFTTGINRWYTETRDKLFCLLSYVESPQIHQPHFVKLGSKIEVDIFNKYVSHTPIRCYIGGTDNPNNSLYYRTAGGGYWVTFLNAEFDCVSVSNKHTVIREEIIAKAL